MTRPQLTRFAPAPTGLLHLGHVVNALFVWGLARRFGARVLLRIEDHDAQRSRPEFEAQLLDDLDWLGFTPDLYQTSAFRAGQCQSRQSDRRATYDAAASMLRKQGRVYGCSCTRQEISSGQARRGGVEGCPQGCRRRALTLDRAPTWRVRMDAGDEHFVDLFHGAVTHARQTGKVDPAIRDRHGNWTYTFAVVVDDLEQGVDLVVRGNDLIEATGAQITLARVLGRPTPAIFAHHRLVMKSATQKLSKADGDSGILELREQGWTPERVIGRAAAAAGLTATAAPLGAGDGSAIAGAGQSAID